MIGTRQTVRQRAGAVRNKGLPSDVVYKIAPADWGHVIDGVSGSRPDGAFQGEVRIVDPDTGRIDVFPDGVPAVIKGRGYIHTGAATNLCTLPDRGNEAAIIGNATYTDGQYHISPTGYVALWATLFDTGPIAIGDEHTMAVLVSGKSGKVRLRIGRGSDTTTGPEYDLSRGPGVVMATHKWSITETSIYLNIVSYEDAVLNDDFKVMCVKGPHWDGTFIPAEGSVVSRPSSAGALRYLFSSLNPGVLSALTGPSGTVVMRVQQPGGRYDDWEGYLSCRDDTVYSLLYGSKILRTRLYDSSAYVDISTPWSGNVVIAASWSDGVMRLRRWDDEIKIGDVTGPYDGSFDPTMWLYFFTSAVSPYVLESTVITLDGDIDDINIFRRYL